MLPRAPQPAPRARAAGAPPGALARRRAPPPPPRAAGAAPATPPTPAPRGAPFPRDFPEAIRQAQAATLAALADGATLIEVEFPAAGLAAVAGDAEGANEMTYSQRHLAQFLRAFDRRAATTRVFFPDISELKNAREGGATDPAGGRWESGPVFGNSPFQLGYLTKPSGLMDLGLDLSGFSPASLVAPTDDLFVAAYPHFDPREMMAVEKLWLQAAKKPNDNNSSSSDIPIITFNAELDRIRTAYYPPLFYPGVGRLAKEMLPLFERAYYIHNFKGAGGGALFRCYPGQWQVFARGREGGVRLVHAQDAAPTLKEVALEILPRAAAAAAAVARAAR